MGHRDANVPAHRGEPGEPVDVHIAGQVDRVGARRQAVGGYAARTQRADGGDGGALGGETEVQRRAVRTMFQADRAAAARLGVEAAEAIALEERDVPGCRRGAEDAGVPAAAALR